MKQGSRTTQLKRRMLRKVAKQYGLPRAVAIAVLAILAFPVLLLAHAHLRKSDPAARERLNASPSAIRLWFTEKPELSFTSVRLRGSDSSEIALGSVVRMTGDPLGITLSIPTPLVAGTYVVLWRTAAADGHATSGSFSFEVASSGAAVAPMHDTTAMTHQSNAPMSVDSTTVEAPSINVSAATRWLEFIAMLAVVGAVVFRFVVLGLAGRASTTPLSAETRVELEDTVRRLAQSALVLLLIAALSRLYEEANAVFGPDRAVDRAAISTLLRTSWGAGWLVGAVGIVVAAIGLFILRRTAVGWSVAALGAFAIAVAPALTGHARATAPVGFSVVTDILHVLAASAWLGGLLALLFAALPWVRGARTTRTVGSGWLVALLVRAFHPVALTCAAIVVATGLIAAWLRLPTLSSLWQSTYGRVLLVKLVFVAVVVVLGALNWRRMLPALGDERAARRITRTAGAELTIAALVLAVTAVLVSTPPPDLALGSASVSVRHAPSP
jgi:copper transport protein